MSRPIPHVDAHGNLTYSANDTDPLCDFCCIPGSVPVAALRVATQEFRLPGDSTRRVSVGEWYVCRPCLDLVLRHDRRALAERRLRHALKRVGVAEATFSDGARQVMLDDVATVHAVALDQLKDWP